MPNNQTKLNRSARLLGALLLLGLLLWLGLAAAERLRTALQPPPPEAAPPRAVAAMTVTPQTFQLWQRYPGVIAAEQEAVISSRLSAPIRDLPVRAGQRVKAGDLLVVLDDREWRQEHERLAFQAEATAAELKLARQQLARREQLHREGAITLESLEESQARVQTLTASLAAGRQAEQAAATRLGYTRIKAPFSGTVGRLQALPGDQAVLGQPLLELFNGEQLKAEFVVPQQELARLTPGRPVRVSVPGFDGEWHGSLDRLHPDLKPPGRGARAEILLPAGPGDRRPNILRPGMIASVRVLALEREQVVAIPVEALDRRRDHAQVFVVENGQARRRQVQPGPEAEGRVVIEAGLRAGEQLITTPYPDLADGEPVRVAAPGGEPE
ncbi:efflux RND transporter periplasmic adaptor subunit [Desulfurivibrio alkaliphilus]|uniref:Efflux transporter, RND family, MFP subunit n=1 Tax=Desulfurivibrio alkaliphilus (strain DSM 19089 / UNIQEM U267 / AHT2) TaxID=589865 RepID=D6Z650_DESAT|nr:efflux RND transporter periplasmic adaptor subunit [Desulfurivibrio alkaliphilus]ADH86815.1 efflux transporter, RND family, MFP subunit [Desulfurivibrio alkaliphilus AHT 2]